MTPNPAFNADPNRRAFGRAGWGRLTRTTRASPSVKQYLSTEIREISNFCSFWKIRTHRRC
jgi:hypothetical protein